MFIFLEFRSLLRLFADHEGCMAIIKNKRLLLLRDELISEIEKKMIFAAHRSGFTAMCRWSSSSTPMSAITIWFAEVITRTLCVPASAFNLP